MLGSWGGGRLEEIWMLMDLVCSLYPLLVYLSAASTIHWKRARRYAERFPGNVYQHLQDEALQSISMLCIHLWAPITTPS